jgi:hypothetical protein
MNILQRKMFAQGEEASASSLYESEKKRIAANNQTYDVSRNEQGQTILPLYEKHAKQLSDSKKGIKNEYGGSGVIVEERGQDPIFDSFLDRYGITPEQYSQIHQQAGNRVIYDPGLKMSAPLLEMAGGKGILQGIGSMLFKKGAKETGEFIGRQANLDSKLNPIKGKFGGTYPQYGDDILTPVTKEGYQLTTPGRIAATSATLPLISGSAAVPDNQKAEKPTDLMPSIIASNQTQIEINKLKEKQDAERKTKESAAKAAKEKDKKELLNIEFSLNKLEKEEQSKEAAFLEKRKDRKERNTGIFLNEIAKAMAGTDNLADGLAIGAANSSDAIMKADEAEELSYAAFKKEEEEKNAPPELKESDIRAIADIYGEAAESLGKSTALKQELGNLVNILQTGSATGATGFVARLADKVQGFFGADGEIRDATAAKNLSLFLEVRLVEAVLDEKGKTISDADRALIRDIVGNLESPLSNKASVINLLGIVNKTLDKKIADANKKIKYHKTRYGTRIPELSIFDLAEGISETKTQGPAAKEYSLDPTLIKPIG